MIDLCVNGVRVTLMPRVSSRAERSPEPLEAAIFLDLVEQDFDRFRPAVLWATAVLRPASGLCGGRDGWLGQKMP